MLALSTGTLVEKSTPYVLPVELARGVVNQLRNQLSDWQMIGLIVPGEVSEKLTEAIVHLSGAVVRKDEPAEAAARSQQALRAALDASQLLANAYAEQAMLVRRRAGKPPPLLGGNLETSLLDNYTARQFLNAFNMAVVPICWRDVEASEGAFSWGVCDTQIEWCRAHGLRVLRRPPAPVGRPQPARLDLSLRGRLRQLAGLGDGVRSRRGHARIGGGSISGNAPAGSTPPKSSRCRRKRSCSWRPRRSKRSAPSIPAAPAILSIELPWCEHVARREVDFPPLQFADALLRAGVT